MPRRANKASFKKGNPGNGGRKLGAVNHTTREVKEAIALTFDKIGGIEAFAQWALKNRGVFYKDIWTKLLPLNLKVDQTVRLETVIEVREQLVASGVPVERIGQLFELPQLPDETEDKPPFVEAAE